MPDRTPDAPAERDPSRLAGLRSLGGDDLARELVALFLEQSREKLAAARLALDARDLPAAGFAAHALKSSAGQLGATAVSAACAAAERAANAGDAVGTRAAVVEATAALDRARGWLEVETAWGERRVVAGEGGGRVQGPG